MNGTGLKLTLVFALMLVLVQPTGHLQAQEEKAEGKVEAKEEASQQETGQEWKTLNPEGAGFSVELPGESTHSVRTLKPLPEVEVKVNIHLLSLDKGQIAFVVGYHDVQDEPTTDAKRKEILDGGIKGTMVNVLGRLEDHERGEFDGHKMRTFSYTGTRGQRDIVGDSRLYLVGRRVYQLSVIRLAEAKIDQATKERFFSSFKLQQ